VLLRFCEEAPIFTGYLYNRDAFSSKVMALITLGIGSLPNCGRLSCKYAVNEMDTTRQSKVWRKRLDFINTVLPNNWITGEEKRMAF